MTLYWSWDSRPKHCTKASYFSTKTTCSQPVFVLCKCVSHLFVGDIDRSAEDDPLYHLTAGRSGQRAGVAIVTSQRGRQQVLQHKWLQHSLFFYTKDRTKCSDQYNMIYTTLLISLQTMVTRLSGADPSAAVSQPLGFAIDLICIVPASFNVPLLTDIIALNTYNYTSLGVGWHTQYNQRYSITSPSPNVDTVELFTD